MEAVINASPIIFLSKIGRINILNLIFDKIYIPEAVIQEINHGKSKENSVNLNDVEYTSIIVGNLTAVKAMLGRLHLGEVEVIVGAAERKIALVVLDDRQARNKAKQQGLNVIGTIGILLHAYQNGFIEDLSAELLKLREVGAYISDDIIKTILERV